MHYGARHFYVVLKVKVGNALYAFFMIRRYNLLSFLVFSLNVWLLKNQVSLGIYHHYFLMS